MYTNFFLKTIFYIYSFELRSSVRRSLFFNPHLCRIVEKEVADPKVVAENESLKSQVSSLKEQLASASSGGAPAPASSGGDDSAEMDRIKAENKSMKEQLSAKFEKFAGNYSDDPDKKMAELMTRNAVLETELENYQKYMKATTKKYEKKIKDLKKKLKG